MTPLSLIFRQPGWEGGLPIPSDSDKQTNCAPDYDFDYDFDYDYDSAKPHIRPARLSDSVFASERANKTSRIPQVGWMEGLKERSGGSEGSTHVKMFTSEKQNTPPAVLQYRLAYFL
jgi:hypothetical protein